MLIGITGNICAGKSEVARFLQLQGFTHIYLKREEEIPDKLRSHGNASPAQYPPSGSLIATIPGTPLNEIKETQAASSEDDTSTSVRNLIHEMTYMSTNKPEMYEPSPYSQRRASTFPMHNHARGEPMAMLESPRGYQVIASDGCSMDLKFETVEELRDYVTRNWQTNYVTTDIYNMSDLDTLSQRPFFLHIAVDAPVSLRWSRFKNREVLAGKSPSVTTLESFISLCDEYMFNENDGVAAVVSKARLTIVNKTQSPELLFLKLANLNLADPVRLRPSWDSYFMRLANLAALRSNCMKRQVGCVLVRDKRVIATGYNGTPRGLRNCNEGGCERCNDSSNYSGVGLVTCLCLHAEENALLESGRDRIGQGSILYCNTCPCLTCSIKIVQTGITEVVYLQPYSMDKASEEVLRAGNTVLRQFIPPSEGIVM